MNRPNTECGSSEMMQQSSLDNKTANYSSSERSGQVIISECQRLVEGGRRFVLPSRQASRNNAR